jgi:hypothetical protein
MSKVCMWDFEKHRYVKVDVSDHYSQECLWDTAVRPNDLSNHADSQTQGPRGRGNWRPSPGHIVSVSAAERKARSPPPHLTRKSWRPLTDTPVASTGRRDTADPAPDATSASLMDLILEPSDSQPTKQVNNVSNDAVKTGQARQMTVAEDPSQPVRPKAVWRSRRVQQRILETHDISRSGQATTPENRIVVDDILESEQRNRGAFGRRARKGE